MAADLVEDPTLVQTMEHDLESAFWVLFWVMLSYMNTDYTPSNRSSYLKQTMNPKCFDGSGGSDKSNLMGNPSALIRCATPDTPFVGKIVKYMHSILGERYQVGEEEPVDLAVLFATTMAPEKKKKKRRTPEQSYELILSTLEYSLKQQWPDPDPGAKAQEVVASNDELYAARSGTKRSRSIAECNGTFVPQPAAKRSEGP